MNERLKPCPFCGSRECGIVEIANDEGFGFPNHAVECDNCGAMGAEAGPFDSGKNEAVIAWNRRDAQSSSAQAADLLDSAQPSKSGLLDKTAEPVTDALIILQEILRPYGIADTAIAKCPASAQSDFLRTVQKARAALAAQPAQEPEQEDMTEAERIAFDRFARPEWLECSHFRMRVLLAVCHEAITRCGAKIENLQDEVTWLKRLIEVQAEAPAQEPEQEPTGQVYGIIDPDYGRWYTIIRKLAWEEGYAIGLHGSFTRDLDLIAVPWADRVREPEHLVRRICASTAGLRSLPSNPGTKPHGRLVWTLVATEFGDPRFVDLSILPIQPVTQEPLSGDELPQLPEPDVRCGEYAGPAGEGASEDYFTADQMLAFRREGICRAVLAAQGSTK